MTTPEPQHIKKIFGEAAEIPSAERSAFLGRACAGDAALRAQVQSLLDALDSAPEFLAAPTGGGGGGHPPTIDIPLNPASAPTVRVPLQEGPGTRIGPYKLLQLIGEGGFGSVFMAEQQTPVQRRVALKIIKLGMDTRQVVARFEAERQALALMDHPNIAKVFDAGATETGRPYFVMELVKGEPITAYCDKASLSITERLELFAAVCQAVQHAHTKGVIHRDIKPSNILVCDQDGRPHAKVIDFGIAKATSARLTEKTLFTEHRQLIGTPEYMSPEQAAGSLDVDTRSDVYSLGVLLYELLTGSTPFDSKTLRSAAFAEIERIIREVEPPNPSTRLTQNTESIASVAASRRTEPKKLGAIIRGELDWIVMKALEKDRLHRYETANAFGLDIHRYLAGEAVIAAPHSPAYRVRKFVRRHRAAVFGAGVVAAALVLGLAGTLWQAAAASRQRDAAITSEARAVAAAEHAAAAEASALIEAKNASQISEFLSDMLKGLAPNIALGRDTTLLREIVDKTNDRVEKELANQPGVATRLLGIISGAYNDLALHDKAEQTARRSVEIARSISGDNRFQVASATFNLASVLEAKGRYDESKAAYQSAYDMFVAAAAPDSGEALRAYSGVGGVLYRLNDFAGAEPIFRRVLEKRRLLANGADSQDLAFALDRLSLVLNRKPETSSEAEPLQREALAMRRRLFGEFHPDVALSISNLAAFAAQQKKFDEAIELSNQAIEQHRKIYGERHPYTATVLMVQAENLKAAGRLPEAIDFARRALDIQLEVLGPNHRTTLNARFGLGNLLTAAHDHTGAEEQYAAMLAYARANYPPGDNRTGAVIMLVADALTGQSRHSDAELLYGEALDARRKNRPVGHPQITQSRNALADCLIAQNRRADAEPLLLAVEQDARAPETPPAARAAALTRLSDFYSGWHTAEPGAGHDAAAAEWKSKLSAPSPGTPAAPALAPAPSSATQPGE